MHPPYETIAAVCTPPGRGAIALLRLSGPEALGMALSIFTPRSDGLIMPGHARLGEIHEAGGVGRIDSGYLVYHPAGRSYTGEDVVELSCHGSPVVVREVLAQLLAAGARPAHPGEFTYRAVLNGVLDLAQAEAVRDLINSATPKAAQLARAQLDGELTRKVALLQEELLDIVGRAEAALEFGEEPDVASARSDLPGRLARLRERLEAFVAGYRQGRLIRDGATVVLAGRPNAGKSSLFNRLLGSERAIVSETPGTTRDFLSERIEMDGIPVTLIDTAGLRPGAEGLEAQGVQRARSQAGQADLILLLIPCGEAPAGEDLAMLGRRDPSAAPILRVASKSDLHTPPGEGIPVSALTGAGLQRLAEAIVEALSGGASSSAGEFLVSDARHHDALSRCLGGVARGARSAAEGMTEEIFLEELRGALESLAEITGAGGIEQIHERIFSTFCIGK